MSVPRKYLAFSLAGAFFGCVSLFFAALVVAGIYASTSPIRSSHYTPRAAPAPAPTHVAVADNESGGRLIATVDGQTVEMPTLETDYDVDVRGDLVTVQVTQRFENPGDTPLDATYQFPLHEHGAVYAMKMRVGDEVVQAIIQREDEAKATFEAAVAEGKVAALTEQHRPNLFQQSVGNLMPGMVVEIELRYVHTAERRDGRYFVALPLVVGPHFNPTDMSGNELVDGSGDHEELPAQQFGTAETIDSDRVSISLRIDAGLPLTDVASDTHALDVQRLGRTDARVGLAAGRVVDNRHFELSYAMAGTQTQAGLIADFDPRTEVGTFSLLIEPPTEARVDLVTPREMVFVLDCSGSMAGQPMDASKAFMRRALSGLRPTDTFRIIRFSDAATEYSQRPIAATPMNVVDAIAYVDGLEGMGGTHMTSGITQALTAPAPAGTMRLVTFMTDGYIGNDFEIVTLLRTHIGDARLFAIGVGSGVNRYLIDEMGRTGRGFARYVDPTEDVDAVAAELAERLQSPLLTDIRLAATDAGLDNVSPAAIPDLFAGQSVRITGTYARPGRHTVTVRGNVAGKAVEIPITVDLPAERTDGDAVRLTWARAQIADRMHLLTTPANLRGVHVTDDQLREQVIQLGLDHSLMTQWTSFVAVSEAVANDDPGHNADGAVAVPPPAGVHVAAPQFRGSTTPEPGIIGGIVMMLIATGGGARRRRRTPHTD